MSNDLNLCQFIGRLGKEPECRYLPSGEAVTSFSIACGSQWKDKANGENRESTEWISCVAFGKLGEICGKYLVKGSQVYVSGRMKTEKYEKDGQTRYTTKIVLDKMQMLGGRSEGGHGQDNKQQQSQTPPTSGGFDDFDDDVPF